MSRRQSVAESTLSSITWGSLPPPLMPPSAKTPENPLRRLSVSKAELNERPSSPSPKEVERRLRRESLAALYPPTPEGVISLARDAASNHSSYWTNVYLLTILPPVLLFALSHRLGIALGAGVKSTWQLLTQDPSDPAYKKAGAVQIAAHLILVPVLIATLYISRDHPWLQYGVSALLGITLIALLPMRPLAAVINALSRGRAQLNQHVSSNIEVYMLFTTVTVIGVGLYALIEHINDDMRYEQHLARERDPRSLQSQLAQQVLALKAELAAMKTARTMASDY